MATTTTTTSTTEPKYKSKTKVKKYRPVVRAILMTVIAAILVTVLLVLAFLLAPGVENPEFIMSDKGGEWGSAGPIHVFSDTIHPGSKGEYKFSVRNENNVNLEYNIEIREEYSVDPAGVNFTPNYNHFMKYRLLQNGQPTHDSEWHSIIELNYEFLLPEKSSQDFVLEWWWPDDIDDDLDTLIGSSYSVFRLFFVATAEVVEVMG